MALGGLVALAIAAAGTVACVTAAKLKADASMIKANAAFSIADQGLGMAKECKAEIRSSEKRREDNQGAIMRELDLYNSRQMDLVTEIRKLHDD